MYCFTHKSYIFLSLYNNFSIQKNHSLQKSTANKIIKIQNYLQTEENPWWHQTSLVAARDLSLADGAHDFFAILNGEIQTVCAFWSHSDDLLSNNPNFSLFQFTSTKFQPTETITKFLFFEVDRFFDFVLFFFSFKT